MLTRAPAAPRERLGALALARAVLVGLLVVHLEQLAVLGLHVLDVRRVWLGAQEAELRAPEVRGRRRPLVGGCGGGFGLLAQEAQRALEEDAGAGAELEHIHFGARAARETRLHLLEREAHDRVVRRPVQVERQRLDESCLHFVTRQDMRSTRQILFYKTTAYPSEARNGHSPNVLQQIIYKLY